MRPHIILSTLWIAFCFTSTHLAFATEKHNGQQQQQASPAVSKVQDVRLAQLILKPKRKTLDVSRDPFRPLFIDEPEQKKVEPTKTNIPKSFKTKELVKQDPNEKEIRALKYIGVMSVGKSSVALMDTAKGRKVLKAGDKIGALVVKEIFKDRIVIDSGFKLTILKRGGLSEN